MKKKLWLIFGPVILGLLLASAFFLVPRKKGFHDENLLKSAATSLDEQVLKGELIKKTAFEKGYLPVIGSSELKRFSPFHPSALQEKYQELPPLFLLGSAGTQSLTHFFSLQELPLKNKKMVVILSPQWFVKDGVKEDYFNFHYSPFLVRKWLLNAKKDDPKTVYIAKRLLTFPIIREDKTLKKSLENLKNGQDISEGTRLSYELKNQWMRNEEKVFSSTLDLNENSAKVSDFVKKLPQISNQQALREMALEEAKAVTANNEFKMKDSFYKKRILPELDKLRQSQITFDYTKSPEFSDFQLLLEEFSKQQVTPLFVIPPVNKRWSDFTGLSQDMLQGFSKKIQYQLRSQGFKHIVDLNNKAAEDYFLEDTIHLGWLGWLAVNDALVKFEKAPLETAPYQMSNQFLSEDWQLADYHQIDQKTQSPN